MAIPGLGRAMTAEQILGMSTDEFKQKIEGAVTKDDLKSLKDETASTLTSIRETLEALKPRQEVKSDPQIEADLNDPTTSMLADPQGFVQRQTQGTQALALQTRADILEMRARQANPGIFQKYGKELMEAAKAYNLASRCQENFWEFHMNSFLGSKVRTGELESGSYPSLLGGSTVQASGSMGGEVNDPNRGFTADQVAYFKERGIPLAKAAAYRDVMHKDGDPIDIATYKKRVENAA
jgi:hypothetical protein